MLVVIGMNPSIADEKSDDPTVVRVVERAKRTGHGGMIIANLCDVVETDSSKLEGMGPMGRSSEANTQVLEDVLEYASNGKHTVLCAWGKPGHKFGDLTSFFDLAASLCLPLVCLGENADGSPVHPLYIAYDKPFLPYNPSTSFGVA